MAVGDKQRLITEILGIVLNQVPQTDIKFDWFINKHKKDFFLSQYNIIDNIFTTLNGDFEANQNKKTTNLNCDAYFGGQYNFIFEFDEYQHFSSARLKTLEKYPTDLKLNFSVNQWKEYCANNQAKADKYRKSKTTSDFNFIGGRTAQRAYLDCFRDLLPQFHGLKPTLRFNEFEVLGINSNNLDSCKKIENLVKLKLNI